MLVILTIGWKHQHIQENLKVSKVLMCPEVVDDLKTVKTILMCPKH